MVKKLLIICILSFACFAFGQDVGNDKLDFTISPNPGQNWLKIKLPQIEEGNIKIEVFDVLGKRVFNDRLTKLETSVQVSNWKPGIYLVRVSNDTETFTKRFMKQ